MNPLIMAAAFAVATIAQPWKAGDTLYHHTTLYVNQYMESQSANFGMSMQGQINLAMHCNDGAGPSITAAVGIFPYCSDKPASSPVARRTYRHEVRKLSAARARHL